MNSTVSWICARRLAVSLGFRVQSLGFGLKGLGLGSGLRIWGLRFRA